MTNDDALISWNDENEMTMSMEVISQEDGKVLVRNFSDGKTYYSYYIDYKTAMTSTRTILVKGVINKTSLIQEVETKLADYIYEMDRYFVLDARSCIYEIIRNRAYDISDEVITEAIKEDYTLLDRDKDDAIEEMIECIDFESLYEIVDEILSASVTIEEKLAEVGMSIHDFI